MRVLYLGLDPSHLKEGHDVDHLPLIEIWPLPFSLRFPLAHYTHFVITSKQAVKIFFQKENPQEVVAQVFAIGPSTAYALSTCGISAKIPQQYTQEGLIDLLREERLEKAHILYPRSQLARPNLFEECLKRGASIEVIDLYTTQAKPGVEIPSLDLYDQVYFTSPSIVNIFFNIYRGPFLGKKFVPIGPVTQKALENKRLYHSLKF
ncbi:MAG: uroporphyrinogen-III synthase [Simkaniaceae bacterium]|nr:uroporphyrinogen-III synthase [Simkaniaceae bacterium]MCF7852487.1 uroporphyrinogen-III synthase [Simkaniaceae bacterium]